MSFNHPRSVRGAAGRLVVFVGLALVALVLAACTGAPPGVAEGVVTVPAPTAPAEKPVAALTQVPAPTRAPAPTQAQPSASLPAEDLTRSAEAGAVTVELTPLNLTDIKAGTLDFQVTMNTHSVELGVDLAKLAVLRVGANEIAARMWQAPAGGGHHVAGTLIFPGVDASGKPVLDGATGFSVVIRNLAGVPERIFTWDLGQAGAATSGKMGMTATAGVTNTMSVDQGDSG